MAKSIGRYPGQTNKDGVFALTGIDLKKGDQVRVKIAASPNKSQPISATIPFKEIVLTDADYYTNTIEGNVSSRINIDGFILESEWIKADSLVFSTIYDENLEGSIFNKTIEASNSSVIVSALSSITFL